MMQASDKPPQRLARFANKDLPEPALRGYGGQRLLCAAGASALPKWIPVGGTSGINGAVYKKP